LYIHLAFQPHGYALSLLGYSRPHDIPARRYGLDIPFWHSLTPLLYYTYLLIWISVS
jgi:hypothetical protein